MKLLLAAIFLTSAIVATPALSRGPAAPPPTAKGRTAQAATPGTAAKGNAILQAGADALMKGVANMTGRPDDPDQGDDHASEVAKQRVCTKSTPAATRSAICDNVSPD